MPTHSRQHRRGDCSLRRRGIDATCSGRERISIARLGVENSRGCLDHAAQTLVLHTCAHIAGGGRTDLAALETRMRLAGTWRPRMRQRGTL